MTRLLALAFLASVIPTRTANVANFDRTALLQSAKAVALYEKSQAHAPARLEFSCDFESDPCSYWSQPSGGKSFDDFDWTRTSGSTTTDRTGPSRAGQGDTFMYIEASAPRKSGEKAVLRSDIMKIQGGVTMSFKYHMYGFCMGTLEVTVNGKQVFKRTGDQGNAWSTAEIALSPGNKTVYFVGEVGDCPLSDMAIDDIQFNSEDPITPEPDGCSFESGLCKMWLTNKEADFTWTVHSGNTSSIKTGPSVAYEGKQYMLMEASAPAKENDKAVLMSKLLDIPGGTVMMFQYHMHGEKCMGSLEVMVDGFTVFTKKGDQGDAWHSAEIDLSPGKAVVEFVGTVGPCGLADIAIDMIQFMEPTVTTELEFSGKQGGMQPTFCSFENGLCGLWENSLQDNFNWTNLSGSTPTSRTGPSRAAHGQQYLYIETSKREAGQEAVLRSEPMLTPPGDFAMSFQYHMYGEECMKEQKNLKVKINGKEVWSRTGSQGTDWLTAEVKLPEGMFTVVEFVGTAACANSDVAIDAISFKFEDDRVAKNELQFSSCGVKAWYVNELGSLQKQAEKRLNISADGLFYYSGKQTEDYTTAAFTSWDVSGITAISLGSQSAGAKIALGNDRDSDNDPDEISVEWNQTGDVEWYQRRTKLNCTAFKSAPVGTKIDLKVEKGVVRAYYNNERVTCINTIVTSSDRPWGVGKVGMKTPKTSIIVTSPDVEKVEWGSASTSKMTAVGNLIAADSKDHVSDFITSTGIANSVVAILQGFRSGSWMVGLKEEFSEVLHVVEVTQNYSVPASLSFPANPWCLSVYAYKRGTALKIERNQETKEVNAFMRDPDSANWKYLCTLVSKYHLPMKSYVVGLEPTAYNLPSTTMNVMSFPAALAGIAWQRKGVIWTVVVLDILVDMVYFVPAVERWQAIGNYKSAELLTVVVTRVVTLVATLMAAELHAKAEYGSPVLRLGSKIQTVFTEVMTHVPQVWMIFHFRNKDTPLDFFTDTDTQMIFDGIALLLSLAWSLTVHSTRAHCRRPKSMYEQLGGEPISTTEDVSSPSLLQMQSEIKSMFDHGSSKLRPLKELAARLASSLADGGHSDEAKAVLSNTGGLKILDEGTGHFVLKAMNKLESSAAFTEFASMLKEEAAKGYDNQKGASMLEVSSGTARNSAAFEEVASKASHDFASVIFSADGKLVPEFQHLVERMNGVQESQHFQERVEAALQGNWDEVVADYGM